jgi:uncharacterized membrane protein
MDHLVETVRRRRKRGKAGSSVTRRQAGRAGGSRLARRGNPMRNVLAIVAAAVEMVSNALGIAAIIVGLGYLLLTLVRNAIARRELPGVEPQIGLGRWLTLSLELTLAADIVGTIVAPSWDEIGKLAAIIVLRTALNYFLAKEMDHTWEQASRERERKAT